MIRSTQQGGGKRKNGMASLNWKVGGINRDQLANEIAASLLCLGELPACIAGRRCPYLQGGMGEE
jgi:hypothetical protein